MNKKTNFLEREAKPSVIHTPPKRQVNKCDVGNKVIV